MKFTNWPSKAKKEKCDWGETIALNVPVFTEGMVSTCYAIYKQRNQMENSHGKTTKMCFQTSLRVYEAACFHPYFLWMSLKKIRLDTGFGPLGGNGEPKGCETLCCGVEENNTKDAIISGKNGLNKSCSTNKKIVHIFVSLSFVDWPLFWLSH